MDEFERKKKLKEKLNKKIEQKKNERTGENLDSLSKFIKSHSESNKNISIDDNSIKEALNTLNINPNFANDLKNIDVNNLRKELIKAGIDVDKYLQKF